MNILQPQRICKRMIDAVWKSFVQICVGTDHSYSALHQLSLIHI